MKVFRQIFLQFTYPAGHPKPTKPAQDCPSRMTHRPGQSAIRLHPGLAGSAMHVWRPSAQGGMPRLPHKVGVGLGVAVITVGVGHLVVIGLVPHFFAQAIAALLIQLHC